MNFRFVGFLVLFALSFSMLGVLNAANSADINAVDLNFADVNNLDINFYNAPGNNLNLSVWFRTEDNNVGIGDANVIFYRYLVTGDVAPWTSSSPLFYNATDVNLGTDYNWNFTAIITSSWAQTGFGTRTITTCLDFNGLDPVSDNNCSTMDFNIHAVDLGFIGNVLNISTGQLAGLDPGTVEFGTTVAMDINFLNVDNGTSISLVGSGNAIVDLNWNSGAYTDSNSFLTGFNVGAMQNVAFATSDINVGGTTGSADLNFNVDYNGIDTNSMTGGWGDANSQNDPYIFTLYVVAADLNAVSITAASNIEYGLALDVNVSFSNVGDFNGSDEDLNLILTDNNTGDVEDFNADFNFLEGDYNLGVAPTNVFFSYTPDSSLFGAVDLNFNITYAGANSGDDNDLTNNSLAWTDTNIVSVDAAAQANSFSNLVIADSNTLEYGTTVPAIFTFVYVNSGDYNGSDDMNVIFNFNTSDENSVIDAQGDYNTGDTVTNSVSYNANGLAVGSYDLNARIVYDWNSDSSAAEFTTGNNYTTVATLDVNSVDLNITAGPTFYNTMIDVNSVELGVEWLVGFTFINVGTFDGNGDVNAILSYNITDEDSNFIYDDSTNIAPASVDINFTHDTTEVSVARDVNVRVAYDANTAGASEADTTNNEVTLSAGQVDVVAVDLNAETLQINDSSGSSFQVEYYDPFTVDFNFANRGDYNGNGTAWIMLDFNGGSDENTFSDTDFNINSVQSATQVSITPTVLGAGIDMNADVNYTANTAGAIDGDTTNHNLSRDINVVYVDLNAETLLINGSSASSVQVEYYDPFTVDFNFVNRGDYNGNGTAWIILDYNGGADENTFSDTDFNINSVQSATQISITPTILDTGVDMNADLNYTTTTGAIQYDDTDTANVLSRDINVVYVDLNAETLLINGSSASSVAVEVDQAFTVDFNFANRGDYNGNGTAWIILDYNGGADENTFSDTDFNINSVQSATQVSITPTVLGTGVDMNADLNYTTTTGAIQYDDTDTANVLSRDINVVSIDLNAEPLSLDDSSVTTNTAVTATLTFSNLQDDINGAEDLNILFYINGTLADYNDDLTQGEFDNVDGDLTVSFSYTFATAGSYDLNILLDYLGTEDDETNNSENATLTVTAPVATPSGGGGGTSGAKKETGTESTEYEFNYGSAESPLYIDTVEVNYEAGNKESANLKVILPNMNDSDKIADEDVTVIKYLELKYSGDQSKIENAIVTFTVGKDEASDPALVKLAHLKDGVWEYYTPSSYKDNGTFYTFEVEVPSFSYFAIVLKASAPGEITPVKEPAKETVEEAGETTGTTPAIDEAPATPETASEGLAWWVWVIIAVVVVVVIVFIVLGLRK